MAREAQSDVGTGGVQFFRTPLAQPMPMLPYAQDLGHQIRDYGVAWNTDTDPDVAVGQQTLRLIRVDMPVAFVALTGGVRMLDGGGFPSDVGDRYFNTFKVRLEYVLSDKIFTIDMLGDAVVGTGGFPRYFVGPALVFDTKANLNVYLTPLYAHMEVTLDFQAVEIRETTAGVGRRA